MIVSRNIQPTYFVEFKAVFQNAVARRVAAVYRIPHTWRMPTKVPPIGERKVSSFLYKELEAMIVECTLPPGAPLSDRQLAEEFGASRTPVREALQLLESAGLAERGHLSGWKVASIELEDVEELYEFRALLEPVGLARIVQWDDAALSQVAGMFDDFSVPMAQSDAQRYLVRDDEFHQLIIGAAENARIAKAYRIIDRQLARCKRFVSYRDDARREESLREHQVICHALGHRDVEVARSEILNHMHAAKEALASAIKTSLSASV
jgi:GntR family transcriptional regulator, rspAB operon transcriptional repressor